MSQRDSGYARKERDLYETPEWVTRALLPHLPQGMREVWEPAAGSGKMVAVLVAAGYRVLSGDIHETGSDFLVQALPEWGGMNAIITNPPYELATEFCEHAIKLMKPHGRSVAMLLRTDFDHAKTRRHLFAENPYFDRKVILTKRIRWFEGSTGSPSFNHAWFIWDMRRAGGAPVIAYDFTK